MRRPAGLSRLLVLAILGCVTLSGAPAAVATPPSSSTLATSTDPTTAELIGQKLVVRMHTTTPSAAFLGRVRRGEIGGVVLFRAFNISTKAALIAATTKLQDAAAAGGQPPLLIMADQEGGAIRTLPWAPTAYSAREMGANGSTTFVLSRGHATGTAILASGVNVDLAPVADVAHGTTGFMYLSGRTFSTSISAVSRLASAFARGLGERGVIATMKHFPGIGRISLNTDRYVQTVTATRRQLAADLAPFKAGIAMQVPMIMLSNATYTAFDASNAAGWSHAIGVDLLRGQLGFSGVTITDSLNGTAAARGVSSTSLALKAVRAGTDMIMLTGSETNTDAQFDFLVAKAEAGAIPLETLRASYARILTLKATLGD